MQKPDVRVNRKFLVFFISFQVIIVGLILFAFLSPKTVTVKIDKLENSVKTKIPLEIDPPSVR